MADSNQHLTQMTNLNRDPLRDNYEFDPEFERERAEDVFENTDLHVRQQDAKAMLAALDALRSLEEQLETQQALINEVWAWFQGLASYSDNTLVFDLAERLEAAASSPARSPE